MTQHDPSKRSFIKVATYVAPAILTLKVAPTFASGGSGRGNGNPNRPGEEPGHSGDPIADGGGNQGGGGSSSASSSHKKKRHWYWPFF
jgi:uncharacterized membrane protein YgcG